MQTLDTSEMPDCYLFERYINGHTGKHTIIHQKRCLKCIRWVHENDQIRFRELLGKALQSKTPEMYNIVHFAKSKGYEFDGLESITKQESALLQQITACSPHFRYPQDIGQIPELAGVYLIVINNKNSKKLAYVGSSLNIYLRIRTHNLEELQVLIKAGVEVLIYCLLFPLEGTEQAMRETEVHLIRELKPAFNGRH